MKKLFFYFTSFQLYSSVIAQPTTLIWEKSLGGSGAEAAQFIKATPDNGSIVAGRADSKDGNVTGNHGGNDFWVVKQDSLGNIEWEESYGGSKDETCQAIDLTRDGGYILGGSTFSDDGDVTGYHGIAGSYADFWVVKIDGEGNLQWEKALGGTDGDGAYSIEQTQDGGYIVGGVTSSIDGDITFNHGFEDLWVVKLDSSGNIQWQKTYGGPQDDDGGIVRQTTDGGYILLGSTFSYSGDVSGHHFSNGFVNSDVWLVRLDANGTLLWQHCLGGSNYEFAYDIKQTKDHGFVIASRTESYKSGDVRITHGFNDYWIVKTDSLGNLQWQKALGGSGDDAATSIIATDNNTYVIAGYSNSVNDQVVGNHGSYDYWVTKLNYKGKLVGAVSLGGSNNETAWSVSESKNRNYIIAGSSQSDDGQVTAIMVSMTIG